MKFSALLGLIGLIDTVRERTFPEFSSYVNVNCNWSLASGDAQVELITCAEVLSPANACVDIMVFISPQSFRNSGQKVGCDLYL